MRTRQRRVAFIGFNLFVGLVVWYFGVLSIWSPSSIRGIEANGNEVRLQVTTRCNTGVRVSVEETATHVLVRFETTKGQVLDCGGTEAVAYVHDAELKLGDHWVGAGKEPFYVCK